VNETATVEVSVADLHRLLLAFRAALTSGALPPGTWIHAEDWDWSFEYAWPDIDGPARWVNIRDSGQARGQHLTTGSGRTLCGFGFTAADVVEHPTATDRRCDVCERERRLQRLSITDA
jgi:hypothetical protein